MESIENLKRLRAVRDSLREISRRGELTAAQFASLHCGEFTPFADDYMPYLQTALRTMGSQVMALAIELADADVKRAAHQAVADHAALMKEAGLVP